MPTIFSKLFKKTRISMLKYIHKERIHLAGRLLMMTDDLSVISRCRQDIQMRPILPQLLKRKQECHLWNIEKERSNRIHCQKQNEFYKYADCLIIFWIFLILRAH